MADQGLWFKLWVGADDDPDMANLSLDDFGRWCRLGIYVKKHGTNGQVEVESPAVALQRRFQVDGFDSVLACLQRLSRCGVDVAVRHDADSTADSTAVATADATAFRPVVATALRRWSRPLFEGTTLIVSFRNWQKYQSDFSTGRTRQFRERERSKRRRDQKRIEEKRTTPPIPLITSSDSERNGAGPPAPPQTPAALGQAAREILGYLNTKTGRSFRPVPEHLKLITARLRSPGVTPVLMRAVVAVKCRQWGGDAKMAGFLRPKTLFAATNFESYLGELPRTAFEPEGAPEAP